MATFVDDEGRRIGGYEILLYLPFSMQSRESLACALLETVCSNGSDIEWLPHCKFSIPELYQLTCFNLEIVIGPV